MSTTGSIPTLEQLPPPPPDRTGWPWTEAPPVLPELRADGSAWPRITVVTPSFNQGQFLEETIRSVLLQGYPDLDYMVIDGGSTDESITVIKRYAPWLSHWVSEPDRGQAHAINKGLARATGEIFNWINSDDFLMPRSLATIGRHFRDCDLLAGGNVVFGEGMTPKHRYARGLTARRLLRRTAGTEVNQMAMWVMRDQALSVGGGDEEMHHAFDTDFFIRYLHFYPRVRYVSEMLGWFRKHPNAKTVAQRQYFIPERMRTVAKIREAEQFASLVKDAAYAEHRYAWLLHLADIVNDPTQGCRRRAFRILLSSRANLSLRWDRVTRRALKALLKGHEIRPFTPGI